VFSRAARWLQPPRRLRPTRAGWIFFLLLFGVGFAALNTGNNLMYLVLALMLAFLVLSGLLSEASLRGIRVRRRLPREMFAERDARIALEIHNDQRRVTALAVVVEDRVADAASRDRAAGRCFALRIAPGATETRSYRLRPERRGPVEFRGFVVITRFPFGLFSKSLVIEDRQAALVYPAVDPLPAPAPPAGATRHGDLRAQAISGASAVASGLRSYAPGDPRRRIHWRASLRSASLLVRDLESERDADAEVRLHTGGGPSPDVFEGRVRRAASEVVSLLESGRRVALSAGEHRFDAAAGAVQRAALLAFLARVEPGAGAPR
jgi:uncharacterized protein (DUF58 family)